MKRSRNMFKVLLLSTFAYAAFSLPATTLQPVEEEPATTLPPPVEVKPTAKQGAVELLDIAGADIQRAVFHQKHTVPDGTVIGTYGYFDSREKYHVLNYVNDAGGLRVISDYTPFDPLPGTATAAAQEAAAASSVHLSTTLKKEDDDFDDEKAESTLTIETKETKQTHVLNKGTRPVLKKQQVDILETGDGDNLLRDEHSIIRTHALPPPGHYAGFANGFYGHHGTAGGFDNAAYPQGSEVLPLRRNLSRYNHVYNNVYYGAQGNGIGFHGGATGVHPPPRRIPLPYENPLYPLLYGDQGKLGVHSDTERGDDINDTSGLDASDAGGEVPSNPGKVEVTNQVGVQTQQGGHYGQAGHIAVGQVAADGQLSGGVAGTGHVAHGVSGHVGGSGHLGGAHFAVLAPPTTIHHGYASNHLGAGAHGYHRGYYPAPQVSAYYQQGYYPQQSGAYAGHHQAGYHQSRYYAPQTAGYAQSHRYYYRYPSQQYGYSHSYQG